MIIGKDCEPYLQSDKVIEHLKNGNPGLHTKVFDCLRKFKNYFFSTIPLKHHVVDEDKLKSFAEEAFSTAEIEFFKTVETNRFKPEMEYCVAFVKTIFFRAFMKLLKQEVKLIFLHGDYSYHTTKDYGENEGEKKLLKKDNLSGKIEETLNKLNEEDRKIYHLRYINGMSRQEIADFLNILPKAVTNKVIRFHERFREEWNNLNKR